MYHRDVTSSSRAEAKFKKMFKCKNTKTLLLTN